MLIALAALIGLGLLAPGVGRAAGWALLLGLVLFCGDLSARAFWNAPLFPRAAPTGGIVLMIGWGLIAVAAMMRLRG